MQMIIKLRTLPLIAAAAVPLAMAPGIAQAGAELELMSGTQIVTVSDNGLGDMSTAAGQVLWAGSINGWNFTVTVGDTKPLLGSETMPQLDLSVTANSAGSDKLVVMFSDTGFGPTSGGILSSPVQNGSSAASYDVLVDPNNSVFGGTSSLDATLTGPYSITLVDTFTPGTVSSDHRVTVPDGGATVALLGFGLVGVEAMRRRFRKL
jgi:hypothetical protein